MASPKHTQSPLIKQEATSQDIRVCYKCKCPKPITDFYKSKRNKGGHKYECKLCDNIQSASWRKANPEKEREAKRKRYARNRASILARQEKYAKSNPEKVRAKSAVCYAVELGELIRPGKCSKCGAPCKPEGHHNSYLFEHWLDVIWLCNSCHQLLHAKNRPQGQ